MDFANSLDKHVDISNVIKGHSESALEDSHRNTKHFSYNSNNCDKYLL